MSVPFSVVDAKLPRQFEVARDCFDQLIKVPSGPELPGFVVQDRKGDSGLQVRFLMSPDAVSVRTHMAMWKHLRGKDGEGVFPNLLVHGKTDLIPYYISEIPEGEPVATYRKRVGPIQPETAVRLVLTFAESLRVYKSGFGQRFAISPKAIWIEKTKSQPRVVMGEISPIQSDNPEAANAALCFNLLEFFAGEQNGANGEFKNLCDTIRKGPKTLESLGTALQKYLAANLAPNFWTDYNQPIPVSRHLATPTRRSRIDYELAKVKLASGLRSVLGFWPYPVGAAALLMVGITVKLTVFSNDEDTPDDSWLRPVQQAAPQAAAVSQPPPLPAVSGSVPISSPIQAPGPGAGTGIVPSNVSAPAPLSAPSPAPPLAGNYSNYSLTPARPVLSRRPKIPFRAPHSTIYSLPTFRTPTISTPVRRRPVPELSLQTREVILYLKTKLRKSRQVEAEKSPGENEEGDDEIPFGLEELEKKSQKAREKGDWLLAIECETYILDLNSSSREAELRLYDALLRLEQELDQIQSEDDIETLEYAAAYNAKAIDILLACFRSFGSRSQKLFF